MPGGAARIRLDARRHAPWCRWRSHEMGMGTATVQAQHRRRAARPPARAGDVRLRRHALPARHDGRRLVADGVDRRGGDRRSRGSCCANCSKLRRQRLAARGPEAGRGRRARRRSVPSSTTRRGARAMSRSSTGRGKRRLVEGEAAAAADSKRRSTRCTPTARSSARCGQRGDRRDARGALPRLVRLRPHPQPEDRGQPVPRRHHHGHRPGADRGDASSTSAAAGS